MNELSVIPIESVDFRPDPYLNTRCGVCGVEWDSHHWHEFVFLPRLRPTREGKWFDRLGTCARYRPAVPGPLDGATIANIPGSEDKARGQMKLYPHEVNPPMHLRLKGGER